MLCLAGDDFALKVFASSLLIIIRATFHKLLHFPLAFLVSDRCLLLFRLLDWFRLQPFFASLTVLQD